MPVHVRIYRVCWRDIHYFGDIRGWLAFRCLPTAIGLCIALIVLASSPARADDAIEALHQVEAGQLLLADMRGSHAPAVLQRSKVHFEINGMVATVSLEQVFSNASDDWVEGVYAFPLPDEAAVRAMEMLIGQRRIVGKIREREVAAKIYRAAKQAGQKASLVEQQRPNLFTNRVANIGPGEQVTVALSYVQPVQFIGGVFSLRFPMTITPRYMPGAPSAGATRPTLQDDAIINPYLGWALPTNEVDDAQAISPLLNTRPGNDASPINSIEISASLDMGMPLQEVEAPYHELALSRRAGVYDINLVGGISEMDRDFVLQWQPQQDSVPKAAFFTEQVEDTYYGLLMVLPPSQEPAAQRVDREIIFVIDTSGSMGGPSIEQARASLTRALQQLSPSDRFNVIAFASGHRTLYRSPMPATRHNLQRALEFVRQLRASGGTEMMPALLAALAPAMDDDSQRTQAPLRQVVFITDGAVGNEAALFAAIADQLAQTRLFTVGIGSAPNSWFMRKAAEFGRGSHTHIGDLGEVGDKMVALFERLSRPAVIDLQVDWPVPVESWPQRLPDLYHGEPLTVAVRLGKVPPDGEVTVRGILGERPWQQRIQLAGQAGEARHRGIASLWARRKIEGLLDQKTQGHDEQSVRSQALPLALQHQLLSPYTSFVAVEEIVSRPADMPLPAQAIANTRPRGQAPQHYAYPRTATTGPAKAWFAALALFMAIVVRVVRQGESDHDPAPRD